MKDRGRKAYVGSFFDHELDDQITAIFSCVMKACPLVFGSS